MGQTFPEPTPCPLEMMLEARDRRREKQASHFATSPGITLVVATVVAPGMFKLTERTRIVAVAERLALYDMFKGYILKEETLDIPSGHETWITLDLPPLEAKRIGIGIEDSHPLGRLFDIDVIKPDLSSISREELGIAPRTCIICDRPARFCMRNGSHSKQEISDFINDLIDTYRTDIP